MFNSNATLPVSIPLNMGNGFGGGFGNDFDSIIALGIVALILGNWNGGGIFGGNGNAGVQDGYILTSDFARVDNKLDGLANGISSLGYDQLGQMNGINTNIANLGYNVQAGFNGVMVNDSNNARDILGAIKDCCCENKTAFLNAQYVNATENCATRQAITDAKAEIIGYLNADKMATLQAENNALRLKESQLAQNQFLLDQLAPKNPIPAYVVQNPYCNCNNGYPFFYGGTTIA